MNKKKKIKSMINKTGILIVVLIFVFPFLWMLITSLKTISETTMVPPTIFPKSLQWNNFVKAWNPDTFPRYAFNSVIVTLSILVLQLLIMIPSAYAFARYNFKGKSILFSLVLIALMIPEQLTFVPIYLQMSKWGLLNTYAPLILPFGASAFGIFMLRQTFKQVPTEILEAAKLDNATDFKIITKIMVPTAKPVLITFGLFSFIYHWNDYFWPLVMTNSEKLRTLPIGVAMLRDTEGGVMWNIVMAGNVILVLPILIVFFFAQKKIIQAFIYSGIK